MHIVTFAFQQQELTPEQTATMVAVLVTALLVGLGIALAINILICALVYGCFKRIPLEHRKMEPGLVWLLLVPLVPLVWNFFVFLRLPESFASYFRSVGRTDVGDCGRGLGLWYAICAVAAIVPCVNYAAGPAALVLLIIFLVKVMGLKKQIPEAAA